ncbi:hypothetical protein M595_5577 [Lyngbya aestuarii BL J]|uniref:Uncharacterized protein n=1 Tax=Lyngbya aestuarii BL J TaxID=1348334 RepID=U7Q9I2_9CYAN|nr:hypothetical protein M595_5577 [Lyngbya aestuarii BL J]
MIKAPNFGGLGAGSRGQGFGGREFRGNFPNSHQKKIKLYKQKIRG